MTEKTKKIILISIGCLLCVAVAVGIATRFGGNAEVPSGVVSDEPVQSGDPDVNINSDNQTDMDIQVEVPDESKTDPAQGADSSGLEQTIQADPVKPEQPEKPEALPEPQLCRRITMQKMYRRRNAKLRMRSHPPMRSSPQITPTETEPAARKHQQLRSGLCTGFGYVENSGENTGIQDNEMYENGNKIGEMGGGN